MIGNKKILIVGPPGVGKTTIKKVFFEMGNPYKLLNTSLEPTRGINSSVFSFFDLNLGVFDLAGQENENWFKSDRNIFNNTNIIICVLDVNTYLKEILDFLNNIINVYKEMKLSNCPIVILIHKVDLIEKLYLQHKLKALDDFLNANIKIKIKIYPTSIAKEYFLRTYDSISEIIIKVVDQKSLLVSNSKIQNFRKDLEIILHYDVQKQYSVNDIFYDLNLSVKQATFHLERLAQLGFVELLEELRSFQLTEKASFFKIGVEQNNINAKKSKINKILETLYYFSNLNQKEE